MWSGDREKPKPMKGKILRQWRFKQMDEKLTNREKT
jgi:hypothetical protein